MKHRRRVKRVVVGSGAQGEEVIYTPPPEGNMVAGIALLLFAGGLLIATTRLK